MIGQGLSDISHAVTYSAPRGEGLRVTLAALPGLTVDTNGGELLRPPFVFQCGPMETFTVNRQFTTGNYDTITGMQFTRRGSEQLRVWSFDTLALRMGRDLALPNGHPGALFPHWVPFPALHGSDGFPFSPEWYGQQLATLLNSGAPFKFTAAYIGDARPILACDAVLTQYAESHKAGEDDAIYFDQVSFSEWRDPNVPDQHFARPRGTKKLPAWVTVVTRKGSDFGAAYTMPHGQRGTRIPRHGATTLVELARYFYGEPGDWRLIARANGLTDVQGNTALSKARRILRASDLEPLLLKIPARVKKPQKKLTRAGDEG